MRRALLAAVLLAATAAIAQPVRVTVLDGGAVVAQDPMIASAGGGIRFTAIGGRTYVLLIEGAGAIVSVNLLIGG